MPPLIDLSVSLYFKKADLFHNVIMVVFSKVLESLINTVLDTSQWEQIRVCAEIGIECTKVDPAKRPDMKHILDRLAESEKLNYQEQSVDYNDKQLSADTARQLVGDTMSKVSSLVSLRCIPFRCGDFGLIYHTIDVTIYVFLLSLSLFYSILHLLAV